MLSACYSPPPNTNTTSTHPERCLTDWLVLMWSEIVWLGRANLTISLDRALPGHLEKVMKDFQFGLLNLVFQIFICFLSFILLSFSWYCNPQPWWPQMILHIQEKWSAASGDDWEGTDWSRSSLLFVSVAVVCDLLGWRGTLRLGACLLEPKRQCRFCHLQSDTVLTPCKWEICKPTAAGHECDTDRA